VTGGAWQPRRCGGPQTLAKPDVPVSAENGSKRELVSAPGDASSREDRWNGDRPVRLAEVTTSNETPWLGSGVATCGICTDGHHDGGSRAAA